jgi:hypothetical protein
MFEEVVTILEESDREVQQALRALERKWASLSHVTDELVAKSLDSTDQHRELSIAKTLMFRIHSAPRGLPQLQTIAIRIPL